jgi:hypothetical protein
MESAMGVSAARIGEVEEEVSQALSFVLRSLADVALPCSF